MSDIPPTSKRVLQQPEPEYIAAQVERLRGVISPPDPQVGLLREALEWAMAQNPRHEGRHRTEPRCRVFMPTDGSCDCGYEQARAALALAQVPAPDVVAAATALLDSENHVIEHLHPEDAPCDAIELERALGAVPEGEP